MGILLADIGSVFTFLPLILIAFIVIQGFFVVKQQTVALIERFGKFRSVRRSGFQWKVPIVDRIAGRVSLKIQQLDVMVETKTADDVFVKLKVSVQFLILPDKVYDAFYKLDNPHAQITAYIFDVVRAEVPRLKLDDVFEKKDKIAIAVKRELDEAMLSYGYGIVKALVTDIDPAEEVKVSMNRINASEREKMVAEYEGEAERIRIVKIAEAEAESKRLQGQGIADQRREIAKGLEDSMAVLNRAGINSQEASALIVITQHYDTLSAVGQNTRSNLIMMPNSPAAASNMLQDMVVALNATQDPTTGIQGNIS